MTWSLGVGASGANTARLFWVSETNLFLGLDLAKRLCLACELDLMLQINNLKITQEIIFHNVITVEYEVCV